MVEEVKGWATRLADDRGSNEFLGFLTHEFVAVVVCPVIALMIVLVAGLFLHTLNLLPLFSFLFGSLFSPFFWWTAALLGFWPDERLRHRSACWVWVLPVLGLALIVVQDLMHTVHHHHTYAMAWKLEYQQFLTFQPDGYAVFFVTVPTVNAIVYSIGAWLALRFSSKQVVKRAAISSGTE